MLSLTYAHTHMHTHMYAHTCTQASPKEKKKKEPKEGGSSNNAFTKNVPLREPLAVFLGTNEMSRPEMTKKFWAYCEC